MKAVKVILYSLAAVVIIATATFGILLYSAHQDYQPMSDAYHHADGDSINLSAGRISYRWHGPEEGEVVVLVHGFATPKFVWQNTIPDLVSAGYRVLAYDHFGRGHSDRPRTPYDREFYVRELQELLDGLGLDQPLNLVGYSMGGANITSFAASYPQRIKQLILLAPAGFLAPYSGLMKQLTTPVIGEQLLTLAGPQPLLKALKTATENGRITEQTIASFTQQFYTQGTPFALSSTLRHYPLYDLSDDYRKLGQTHIPVTAIWGEQDAICPIAGAKTMHRLVPQLRLHPIADARHDFTFTQPSRVNPLILEALQTL